MVDLFCDLYYALILYVLCSVLFICFVLPVLSVVALSIKMQIFQWQ